MNALLSLLIALQLAGNSPRALTVTRGGTYSGDYSSILVATTSPVIIQNSTIRGPGPLIVCKMAGAHLTIRNCRAEGLNPNVAGKAKREFLDCLDAASLDIEHNLIQNVGGYGISINGYHGDPAAGDTFKILANQIDNLDGRFSDGHGGYQSAGEDTPHAIILQRVHNVSGIEIAWNQITNEPSKSYVNDVINIYESSGTKSAPLHIHDNLIHGLYAIDPAHDYDSGCGIICDGTNDPAHATAFVQIEHNQIISTGNAGIAVAAGHDNSIHDNRILSSGKLPDGTAIFAQNIGCYIHPMSPAAAGAFVHNTAHDNQIAWLRPPHTYENQTDSAKRGDWWLPDADPALPHENFTWPGTITQATEQAELATWTAKLKDAVMIVGPN